VLPAYADSQNYRSLFEPARDVARAIARTDAYLQSRKDRKKVEMLFAHLKRILKLDRLRLRRLSGTQDEFLLTNMKHSHHSKSTRMKISVPTGS
jgi:hypothetical protein